MTPDERLPKNHRLALIAGAFSPAAPVNDKILFADRPRQVDGCIEAVFERGRHIALYGERGVGKTSLAIMLPALFRAADSPALDGVRVDCNTEDTFHSVWKKIFRELRIPMEAASDFKEPEDVRFVLQVLGRRVLIVIDELDRMEDDNSLSLLADTIKSLSDHSVDATLMFVGVADSLIALLGEHGSIVRSLVQIHMPRMSDRELGSIVDLGMTRAQLRMEPEARSRIILLSEGLPHYPHLLAKAAGTRAVQDDREVVALADLEASMEGAVNTHSLSDEYRKATRSNQPGHLFEEVMLACAFAPRDELGFFRPADLRQPLAVLVGRSMEIANFQKHLQELSGDKRGHALQREGEPRNYRYRFTNPLLQPYTKIRALAKRRITEGKRCELEGLRRGGRYGAALDE